MKLECVIVKDLYVAYSEKELSEVVRVAVEEHLGECENCNSIYHTGVDFQTSLETELVTTTQKLDDKVLMKLKLARLRALLLFIVIILAIISINIYSQSRSNLNFDFSRYSMDINGLKVQLALLKSPDEVDANSRYSYTFTTATLLNNLNKEYEPIYRELNPYEKYFLKKISYNQCFDLSLTNLILLLHNRMENGYFSDKDEKVYSILKKEIDNLEVLSTNSSHGLNSKYYILNTKEFLISFNKINQLAKFYTKYNKLPEEIKFLSQEQLKVRIKNVLGEDIKGIQLISSDNNNYFFVAHLKDGINNYDGTIDTYSGRIIRLDRGGLQTKGTLISLEKAKETAKDMVLRNYGKDFDVKIKDLGINNNYYSYNSAKVYCFEVQPTFMGYAIYSTLSIHVDGFSDKIIDFSELSPIDNGALAEAKDLKVDIKFAYKLALQNLDIENLDKANIDFSSTHFIKSMFSGEYVLVHEYRGKENTNGKIIYINTYNDKMDLPAVEEGTLSY